MTFSFAAVTLDYTWLSFELLALRNLNILHCWILHCWSCRLQVFESVRYCGRGDGAAVWPPGSSSGSVPATNASYFRVRTMEGGTVVGVVTGSEGYAYGSAMVDPITSTAWVFGSHSDLCGDRVYVISTPRSNELFF